jgi:ABC-type uncharacterized transport system fused permease/ATPase subunit
MFDFIWKKTSNQLDYFSLPENNLIIKLQYFYKNQFAYPWHIGPFAIKEALLGRDPKTKHSLYVLLIVILNIVLAFLLIEVNEAYALFSAILSAEILDLSALYTSSIYVFSFIVGYIFFNSVISFSMDRLANNINTTKRNELINEKKAWDHADLYDQKNNPDFVHALDKNTRSITKPLFNFIHSTIKVFFRSIIGIRGLWNLSSTLSFVAFGCTITIPGYIALASVIYSMVYAGAILWLSMPLSEKIKIKDKFAAIIHSNNHSRHINALNIKMRQGNQYEDEKSTELERKHDEATVSAKNIEKSINFLDRLHGEFSYFIGIFLSIPSVLSKKILPIQTFQIAQYFSSVVDAFTWYHANTPEISSIKENLDKAYLFQQEIERCAELKKRNEKYLKITYNDSDHIKEDAILIVSNLKLAVGRNAFLDTKPINNFIINKKERIKIIGKTGSGKSTLLKILTAGDAFSSGEIYYRLSQEKIIGFPQFFYTPYKATLLESLYYPSNSKPKEKGLVAKLMREFGLESKIKYLDEADGWVDTLSGGEKQRIYLISMLIQETQPELLFLDEIFASLGDEYTNKVHSLLSKKLPNTTIICSDHTSPELDGGFYTRVYDIEKGQFVDPKNYTMDSSEEVDPSKHDDHNHTHTENCSHSSFSSLNCCS